MRTSLVSTSRRAVSTVCSACRRKEAIARFNAASVPIAPPQRAFSTTITTTTTTTSSSSQVSAQPRNQPTRRWLSSSSAPPPPSQPKDQPPKQKVPTYYALFPETLPQGPPPAGPFEIDTRALRREFLRLQAAAHPDFHHSASGTSEVSARRQAEITSALINQAYKTLSNPLLRAQYLLSELSGVDLAADESGSDSGPADPELLMTVLEAREAIEEAVSEKDLEEVRAANEERIKEAEANLAEVFAQQDWEGAKGEAVRLRYWYNIREGIDNWEPGKPVVLQH
ncbi:J-type co-chaperone JAC1, mitochondrial [Podospora australis]|uniref:J-type co-chaperone JAC1, mitochondrial n=1 Tax=Podospora australis TaxID=1536484 RepID=A0AAN6WWP9_9PEZI|nr:J-type co-chaperone JAC1, mitochondrial [Podospora australis]